MSGSSSISSSHHLSVSVSMDGHQEGDSSLGRITWGTCALLESDRRKAQTEGLSGDNYGAIFITSSRISSRLASRLNSRSSAGISFHLSSSSSAATALSSLSEKLLYGSSSSSTATVPCLLPEKSLYFLLFFGCDCPFPVIPFLNSHRAKEDLDVIKYDSGEHEDENKEDLNAEKIAWIASQQG
jgi:hypothetical protein